MSDWFSTCGQVYGYVPCVEGLGNGHGVSPDLPHRAAPMGGVTYSWWKDDDGDVHLRGETRPVRDPFDDHLPVVNLP